MPSEKLSSPKRLLLITSLCGGGHIQAAKAKAMKAIQENPSITIIQKDILMDWVGKCFGKTFIYIWNTAQKKGNLSILNFLSKNISIADFLLWPYIFLRSFYTLLKENIDQVIDTQPIGTSAIIKAIKCTRKITNKPLTLEKIVTELPTKQVHHFFKPIKRLSKEDRYLIKLISASPLLSSRQTAESFWQKHCGLSEKEICYEKFPLRPTFEQYRSNISSTQKWTQIEIKVNSYEEKYLIANTIKRGSLQTEIYRNKIAININPDDKVATILLGSQPAEEATIKYVKSYVEMMKKQNNFVSSPLYYRQSKKRHLLFVFCNRHIETKQTLLRRLHEFIQKIADYPENLNIIPMCFQSDEVIAPLYHRSNATFTRSGGLTSMELMAVAQGKIWIHSETKRSIVNRKKLAKGMPIWESGNATYLREKKGARFITPEKFSEECKELFFSSNPAFTYETSSPKIEKKVSF